MKHINEIIGMLTLLAGVAGGTFAFINRFWLNPQYNYIDSTCKNLLNYGEDMKIKIEKRNGKVNQVFCRGSQKAKCQYTKLANKEEYGDCWVYKN